MDGEFGSTRTLNLIALVVLAIGACLGIGAVGSNDKTSDDLVAGYTYIGSIPSPTSSPSSTEHGFFTSHWSWPGAFGSECGLTDESGAAGYSGPNGVPDFIDRWAGPGGHLQAVFVFDDLSGGRQIDRSALVDPEKTGPARVSPTHDLVNAYAFATRNDAADLLLYAAVERLAADGPTELVFEFNQDRFHLAETGGIEGQRADGDLRVRAAFDSLLDSVEISVWRVGAADGVGHWTALDSLVGRRCNPPASICALSNSAAVDVGPWPSYDSTGQRLKYLAPGTLFEVAINLSRLSDRETDDAPFASLQIASPTDFAVAGFSLRNASR
jgi:hypothetical protein